MGLDREKKSHHHVVISAVDGGGLSCDVDVYIELSDVNDNAPQFVDLPQKFSLLESAPVNTLLLRITADDPDLGKQTQAVNLGVLLRRFSHLVFFFTLD